MQLSYKLLFLLPAQYLGEMAMHVCWQCVVCFQTYMLLQALATCSEMRPPVDISVGGEGSSEGVGAGGARVEYSSSVARA